MGRRGRRMRVRRFSLGRPHGRPHGRPSRRPRERWWRRACVLAALVPRDRAGGLMRATHELACKGRFFAPSPLGACARALRACAHALSCWLKGKGGKGGKGRAAAGSRQPFPYKIRVAYLDVGTALERRSFEKPRGRPLGRPRGRSFGRSFGRPRGRPLSLGRRFERLFGFEHLCQVRGDASAPVSQCRFVFFLVRTTDHPRRPTSRLFPPGPPAAKIFPVRNRHSKLTPRRVDQRSVRQCNDDSRH